MAKPIHLIWSISLASGDVPSFYKFSNVSPLHKKESKALPSNYRPISLTSHIIKVFERIIRKILVLHLEMNNLICNKQHGFRSGRSCLHHFDDIFESLLNNADFDSIYLDYAKAFDKVDHKLLIKKLRLYGINPKIIKWIESILSDRQTASLLSQLISCSLLSRRCKRSISSKIARRIGDARRVTSTMNQLHLPVLYRAARDPKGAKYISAAKRARAAR